nr:hypothetical protein [Tanacetum cinerariifolium]
LGLRFIILDWEHFFGGSSCREYFTWMIPRVQPQRKLREDASSQNHNQPNYLQNCLMLEHETKRATLDGSSSFGDDLSDLWVEDPNVPFDSYLTRKLLRVRLIPLGLCLIRG